MDENEKIEEKIEEKVEEIEPTEVIENQTTEVVENVVHEEEKQQVNYDGGTDSKTLSIASLVLGILAFFITKTGIIAIACAVLAIVFGVKGQKKDGKGMAKAGMILGIVYLSFIALAFILVTVIGVAIFSSASTLF